MSGTMNNTLQSPKARVSTSCYHVARVKESNPVTSHVSSKTQLFQRSDRRKHCKPSSQMNHVEDLFPEFFNRKSDNTLNRSFKIDFQHFVTRFSNTLKKKSAAGNLVPVMTYFKSCWRQNNADDVWRKHEETKSHELST